MLSAHGDARWAALAAEAGAHAFIAKTGRLPELVDALHRICSADTIALPALEETGARGPSTASVDALGGIQLPLPGPVHSESTFACLMLPPLVALTRTRSGVARRFGLGRPGTAIVKCPSPRKEGLRDACQVGLVQQPASSTTTERFGC
jgi:DNA-binding NarL/FixJ family response regulator